MIGEMMVQQKEIYLLLTDTRSWFTRLIKFYTKKPYNHASIAFDQELEQVYSFGRKAPKNPFIGGFVKENMNEGLFKHANGVIYSVSVTEEQWQKIQQYIRKINAEKDAYRYNFIGLFGFLLKRPINRKNAFFCSQFVATVLQESNVTQFSKPIPLVTPYDLQKADVFQLVYKGEIKEYCKQPQVRSTQTTSC